MQVEASETAASATKAGVIWTGVYIGHTAFTYADIAAILAAIYSALLIADWLWKHWKTRER